MRVLSSSSGMGYKAAGSHSRKHVNVSHRPEHSYEGLVPCINTRDCP
jgi:hypothetical protein